MNTHFHSFQPRSTRVVSFDVMPVLNKELDSAIIVKSVISTCMFYVHLSPFRLTTLFTHTHSSLLFHLHMVKSVGFRVMCVVVLGLVTSGSTVVFHVSLMFIYIVELPRCRHYNTSIRIQVQVLLTNQINSWVQWLDNSFHIA